MGTVNWNEPIEAVHTDGTMVPVTLCDDRLGAYYLTEPPMGDGSCIWRLDGTNRFRGSWSIRNVRTARTSDETLRRMEALVKRMAAEGGIPTIFSDGVYAEARAIQALLEPVDPRFDAVLTAITQQGVAEPVARLAARDVLKALDAAGK